MCGLAISTYGSLPTLQKCESLHGWRIFDCAREWITKTKDLSDDCTPAEAPKEQDLASSIVEKIPALDRW